MKLSDVCLMYGIPFEKVVRIVGYDADGFMYNNGINDFMTIDLGLRLVIVKLNGEKKIYYTKEFKVALELEYFLDGEVVANHCSDNDGKIDFIFDYSNERAINFFEEEL